MMGFCFLSSGLLMAQETWSPKWDMPNGLKEITDATTVLDGNIYVLGGTNDSGVITNAFNMYDPAVDLWFPLPSYPLSVWRASMEVVDGIIYAFGGYESLGPFPFSPTNKAFSFDPATNQWTPIMDLPISRGSAASGVVGSNIHLIGGANASGALNLHQVYSPFTDSWTTYAPMSTERSGLTASVIGDLIVVAGGYFLSGGVQSLNSAEVYNPNTDIWSPISSMPFTKLGVTSAAVLFNMYVFGNESSTNVLEYNTLTDQWQILGDMPSNVNFAGAESIDGIIYLMGGGAINLITDGISTVNCFNPEVLSVSDNLSNSRLLVSNVGVLFSLIPNTNLDFKSIEIFNAAGFRVDYGGKETANIWNASAFKEGIYFIVFQLQEGHKITKKVIVKK